MSYVLRMGTIPNRSRMALTQEVTAHIHHRKLFFPATALQCPAVSSNLTSCLPPNLNCFRFWLQVALLSSCDSHVTISVLFSVSYSGNLSLCCCHSFFLYKCGSSPYAFRIDQWISESADASTSPTLGHQRWHPIMTDMTDMSQPFVDEPKSIFTTDQFRPTSPSYFHLIPACIDLFMEHIYPIMPLIYMPTLRASITRPLEMYEKNLLYALCALTSTHMIGKSIQAPGPPSWEAAGRFFLDECISVRQSYDFVEDRSLWAVISSYLVHTAFFELNQSRKSWYYLREALTMGQDLGIHDEKSYIGLSPAEALCRRRTFWILYVTERYEYLNSTEYLAYRRLQIFCYSPPQTHNALQNPRISHHAP
jgi:hypothetical protein